jgi:hypothetical protein
LLALRNSARYYGNSKLEEIPGTELMGMAKPYFIYGFAFVAYANRDSTPFRERYNIPEAQTSFAELSATKPSPNLSVFLSTLASLVKKQRISQTFR